MANNEIIEVIKVETSQAETSMKDLRKEVSELRDKLLNLDKSSEEYTQTVEQLRSVQDRISSVMNATKQSAEVLAGSYNALVKEMSELKKRWRETNDIAERDVLGQRINEINNELKNFDSSIGVFNRNVGSYEQAIENAIEKNLSFGDAMREMQQSTEQTRAKFEAVQKISSGLASGYSALTGVTALLGVENEEFEKTLIKLQSAMSIAQGVGGLKDLIEGLGQAKVAFGNNVKAIKTFIKSLNGVKGALISTGIGAFVVLLGVVIANWEKISKWLGIAKDKQVDYNQALKDYNNLSKEFETNLSREIELLKLKGATEEELRTYELAEREKELNRKNKAVEEAEKLYKSAQGKEREEAQKHYDELKQDRDAYEKDFIHKQKVFNLQTINEQEKQNQAIADANQQAAEEQKQQAEAIAEEARQSLIDTEEEELAELERIYLENKALLEKNKIDTKELTDKYEKEKTEIEQKYAKEREDIAKAEREQKEKDSKELLSTLQSELTAIREETDDKLFQIDMGIETTDDPLEQIQNEIRLIQQRSTAIIDGYNAEIMAMQNKLDNEKLLAEERKQIEADITATIQKQNRIRQEAEKETFILKQRYDEDEGELRKRIIEATLATTSKMLGSLASLYEENSKEYKGIMATQAVVDALASANGAYNSLASIKIVGPIIAPIAAAAALVAGYANVKKILSANKNTQLTPQTPTVPNVEVPNIQNVRNIQTNSELEEMNKTTKVYVAETDIEDVRRKIEVAETSSTF